METVAEVLRHANGLKEGWGWGVNHGDIALTLSAVDAVLLAESVAAMTGDNESGRREGVEGNNEVNDEGNDGVGVLVEQQQQRQQQKVWAAEAGEMLALAQSRRDEHGGYAAWLVETRDLLDSLSSGSMVAGGEVAARAWLVRWCAQTLVEVRPRKPMVLPTPQGKGGGSSAIASGSRRAAAAAKETFAADSFAAAAAEGDMRMEL